MPHDTALVDFVFHSSLAFYESVRPPDTNSDGASSMGFNLAAIAKYCGYDSSLAKSNLGTGADEVPEEHGSGISCGNKI